MPLRVGKYYEHHVQEYPSALYWTESAIEIVLSRPGSQNKIILKTLGASIGRLNRLMAKQNQKK